MQRKRVSTLVLSGHARLECEAPCLICEEVQVHVRVDASGDVGFDNFSVQPPNPWMETGSCSLVFTWAGNGARQIARAKHLQKASPHSLSLQLTSHIQRFILAPACCPQRAVSLPETAPTPMCCSPLIGNLTKPRRGLVQYT